MLTSSDVSQFHAAQQTSSETAPPTVLSEQPLPPHEIERICRVFIRLITAKEIDPHDKPASDQPTSHY